VASVCLTPLFGNINNNSFRGIYMKKTLFSTAIVVGLLIAFSSTSIFAQQTSTKKTEKTAKVKTTKTAKAPKPMVKPESKIKSKKTTKVNDTKTEKAPKTTVKKETKNKVSSKNTAHKAPKMRRTKKTGTTKPIKN
jgi:outer membrane biosynthesis protein TonB